MEMTYTEIEMQTDKNGNVLFNPTQEVLRGRWTPASKSLRGFTSAAGMNQMPELPGMIVGVDPDTKEMVIRDPLADPENRELVDEANRVLSNVFSIESRPADERRRHLNDDDYKTLLYWMARTVDSKQARVVSGRLPSVEEVRSQVPGRIRKYFWDTGKLSEDSWEEDASEVAQEKVTKKTTAKPSSNKPMAEKLQGVKKEDT